MILRTIEEIAVLYCTRHAHKKGLFFVFYILNRRCFGVDKEERKDIKQPRDASPDDSLT